MIFFDSNPSESLIRFRKRGFHSYSITISEDREKRIRRYFSVISSGKRNKLFSLLFNKWLWDELTKSECTLLYHLPEFFKSEVAMSAFRALQQNPKIEVRKRILKLDALIGLPIVLNHKSYYGLLNNLLISVSIGEKKFPRTIKYSGYTKHYKDRGSLRSGSIDEPLAFDEEFFDQENFFFDYFSGIVEFP